MDHIYSWTRLEGNLLQDKKKKIVIYVMYVIPHISNRILDFFWELPYNGPFHSSLCHSQPLHTGFSSFPCLQPYVWVESVHFLQTLKLATHYLRIRTKKNFITVCLICKSQHANSELCSIQYSFIRYLKLFVARNDVNSEAKEISTLSSDSK